AVVTVPLGVGAVVPAGYFVERGEPGPDEGAHVGPLLAPGEQVVGGEGRDAIEGRGHAGEPESGDRAALAGHEYGVLLPQYVLVGAHPPHHRQQLPVAAEEYVQTRLER